ncbi:MAG TPA: hypothetical protein VLC08_00470 [Chitinolyticbacter sp.]|nr:hypothetical protein [Chitinolyticbacter sp.]
MAELMAVMDVGHMAICVFVFVMSLALMVWVQLKGSGLFRLLAILALLMPAWKAVEFGIRIIDFGMLCEREGGLHVYTQNLPLAIGVRIDTPISERAAKEFLEEYESVGYTESPLVSSGYYGRRFYYRFALDGSVGDVVPVATGVQYGVRKNSGNINVSGLNAEYYLYEMPFSQDVKPKAGVERKEYQLLHKNMGLVADVVLLRHSIVQDGGIGWASYECPKAPKQIFNSLLNLIAK